MKMTITGHRPQRLRGQEQMIADWAKEQLIRYKPTVLYNGMARGADQIVAGVAKQLGIPIVCCYPFPKVGYSQFEEYIKENNEVVFVCPSYSKGSYTIRDKYMVDHADTVLCIWDGICAGGTYITRQYALKKNKQIIDYQGLRI